MQYGSHANKRFSIWLQTTFLVFAVTVDLLSQSGAFGQPPAAITSSGLGTVVTTNGNIHDITGGTRPGGASGTNLFHSFGDFSVPTNNIANFLNAGSVDLNGNVLAPNLPTSNILGRVTAGNPSVIFGMIQTNGTGGFGNANLFLMNPAGFLFGPTATVNVGGMVAFTTADYLRFQGSETLFNNASTPESLSPLSVAPVAAFGFLGSNPAAIAIQGSTLQVAQGQSMSFVGGNQGFTAIDPDTGNPISVPGGVTMTGGTLSAPGGQINLVSVASTGEILSPSLQSAPNVTGQSFTEMGTITLSQGATLDASGENSGTVRIRSGQFIMDSSSLFAGNFGDTGETGNAVSIDVTNDVLIKNQSALDATSFGTGQTGDIEIQAKNLSLTEGSYIAAQGFGGAAAGNISLTIGNRLIISGTGSLGNGSLITTSGPGTGAGGAVTVNASDMVIADQGTIRTEGGAEFAGGITLGVQSLTLSTGGSIQAFGGDFGPSGNIKIVATKSISLNGNGDFSTRILSENTGTGGTGTITIETGALTLSNSAQMRSETWFIPGVTAVPKLSITADSVTVSDRSRIDITSRHGDIGALEISARSVTLADRALIRSTTSAEGNSGSINIAADNISLSGGSQINSSTDGNNVTGQGGDISLTVTEKLSLTGSFTDISEVVTPSAIQSNTEHLSLGDAGRISITAGTVDISNGALIASRSASGATGDAGNIDITATNGFTMQNSAITTEAGQGASGGDIKVTTSPEATVWLLQDSKISASVADGPGGGGNISIDPQFVILQNSQILARTDQGQGGTITITTNLLLQDATSIVNADSGSGLNGTVTIQSPNAPISGQIQPLGKTPLIATSLLNQRCASLAGGEFSSFTVAGRDSLPTEPGGWLASPLYAAGVGEGSGVRGEGRGGTTLGASLANETTNLSLRQIAPAGFLTQAFAVEGSTSCHS